MNDDKLSICFWFEDQAEEAARFYCGLFPDSEVKLVNTAPMDWPAGKAGDVITVDFTLLGQRAMALNGGAFTQFNEAISLQVFTDSQEETDRYWDALVGGGGEAMMCSWCKDRYGVRWQIVPCVLMEGLGDPDPAAKLRVFAAMNRMQKIDHVAIEAARRGE